MPERPSPTHRLTFTVDVMADDDHAAHAWATSAHPHLRNALAGMSGRPMLLPVATIAPYPFPTAQGGEE